MKDTVSHYVPPHSPLTSTEPQVFSNNLTMPACGPHTSTCTGSHAGEWGGVDGQPGPIFTPARRTQGQNAHGKTPAELVPSSWRPTAGGLYRKLESSGVTLAKEP